MNTIFKIFAFSSLFFIISCGDVSEKETEDDRPKVRLSEVTKNFENVDFTISEQSVASSTLVSTNLVSAKSLSPENSSSFPLEEDEDIMEIGEIPLSALDFTSPVANFKQGDGLKGVREVANSAREFTELFQGLAEALEEGTEEDLFLTADGNTYQYTLEEATDDYEALNFAYALDLSDNGYFGFKVFGGSVFHDIHFLYGWTGSFDAPETYRVWIVYRDTPTLLSKVSKLGDGSYYDSAAEQRSAFTLYAERKKVTDEIRIHFNKNRNGLEIFKVKVELKPFGENGNLIKYNAYENNADQTSTGIRIFPRNSFVAYQTPGRAKIITYYHPNSFFPSPNEFTGADNEVRIQTETYTNTQKDSPADSNFAPEINSQKLPVYSSGKGNYPEKIRDTPNINTDLYHF